MITRTGTRTRCFVCGAPTRTLDTYDDPRETLCDACLAADYEAAADTLDVELIGLGVRHGEPVAISNGFA